MSASALADVSGVFSYDYTSGTGQAYGTNAQTNLGAGVFGMMGGDANGDGDVDGADFLIWQNNAGSGPGYNMSDLTMDNQVENQDKNEIWIENTGHSSQVPE